QCIGNQFAMMEAQLVLATLAQRYRLRTLPGYTAHAKPVFTLHVEGGLPMIVERR
ncbi:MAG: cytochrome P450, partial [Caldilineaceae bacterium]|nr:cytochrome P450 [Caldilineaceae bacterium]